MPAPCHNRTGQILPKEQNEMQSELDSLNECCRLTKISMNQKKKIVHDFQVVEELKLAGYQITANLFKYKLDGVGPVDNRPSTA